MTLLAEQLRTLDIERKPEHATIRHAATIAACRIVSSDAAARQDLCAIARTGSLQDNGEQPGQPKHPVEEEQ
jgi:hypothetical protein